MNFKRNCYVLAPCIALSFYTAMLYAQSAPDTVESHLAIARAAGAKEHPGLFDRICSADALKPPSGPVTPPPRNGPPPRSTWHVEPVKVFDNLYYVGEKEYSAWAVITSQGIIILDTIFDYSVEDEVVEGLKKLGLDPKNIKYAVVSHGHFDHSGGARYLQEHFDTRVLMSAADWDLLDRNTRDPSKPKRDMVVTDGMKLTLGDTTLTFYLTPGHTPGTVSTLIPVKDHGQPHLAAAWGGTAFNFARSVDAFKIYTSSAERFRDIVTQAGADVIISNHTAFDGTKEKIPALEKRGPGDPHPYVIGTASVSNYLTVASECSKAAMLNLNAGTK
jgi:metallo-beta-lactamase class B